MNVNAVRADRGVRPTLPSLPRGSGGFFQNARILGDSSWACGRKRGRAGTLHLLQAGFRCARVRCRVGNYCDSFSTLAVSARVRTQQQSQPDDASREPHKKFAELARILARGRVIRTALSCPEVRSNEITARSKNLGFTESKFPR
jgi:hypothetical protein